MLGNRLAVRVRKDRLEFGRWVTVSFQRTLRIPDDGPTGGFFEDGEPVPW